MGSKWSNKIAGLCGNGNSDDSDDFIYPNGTIPTTTEEIYNFAYQTSWVQNAGNSMFMYGAGRPTFAAVNRANYQPRFGACNATSQEFVDLGKENEILEKEKH